MISVDDQRRDNVKIMGQKVRKGNYDCKIKSFGNAGEE